MKRFLLILLTFSMLCGLLAGCKKTTEETSNTTTSETNPPDPPEPQDPGTPPESVTVGNVRVQLLSDTIVRLEVKGPKGFEDRPSFHVTKRTNWDKVAYETSTTDGVTVITANAYKIYIPEKAKTLKDVYITSRQDEELWRYETDTKASVYLPSPSDELNSWYFTDAPRVIPSENGYSVMEEYKRNNGWDLSNDATDTFVFLPQGSYETFTKDFTKLTGSSELITLKMLGYWDSRWYAYSATTALQQIDDYLDRGYSIDVLVIDTDWRDASSGTGYTINKNYFPNMADFLEKAHEKGVNIVFNDHPEPTAGTTNLLDKKEVEYRNKNLKLILSLGLDAWWYDRNWSVSLKPIDNDISIYASGMYAFQWITEDYYNSITDIGEYARRGLIMANVDGIWNGNLTNASDIAAHRYTLQWTGDIGTGADSLAAEIFDIIYGGAELGIPYMSSDLGGHTSDVSPDMYVRWLQYGALSPICRVHCTKPYSRMPWLFGETAEAVTHTYVDMRYRLLPLYYAMAYKNYSTGLPLVKRLDVLYPEYAEADANDEYLLGDSLLIAPLSDSYPADKETHFESNGNEGLYGEYFSNRNMSGEPTVTRYDKNIYFDWVADGPQGLSVVDNFSIRWTGDIVVGSDDCVIRMFADDGVRVYIDDKLVINGWSVYDRYLYSDPLEANSTHSIKIEYFDAGNYAHIYMTLNSLAKLSRDVFIPDGEWMDVWTGETFVGPATVTVSHGLETSPIFVRMGTVLALADNMKNTSEKDWSHLTLDLYPSTSYKSSFTLYEDDTETVAYKDGKFRTTDITLEGSKDKNTVTLTVNPANGSFEGKLAFTSRNYTARIHGRADWGALKSVTVNGSAVDFKTLNKDEKAKPFAISGGMLDNTVYEITFSSNITDMSTVVFTFESTTEDRTNTEYDRTNANLDVSVEKLVKASTAPNLTSLGNKDWAVFGTINTESVIRKNIENHLVGDLSTIGSFYQFNDNYTISWQDGDIREIGSSTNGTVTNHIFEITLKVTPDKTHYQVYLGGYRSVAKLTVRDRAGNAKTLTFGDINTNFYRMINIDCQSETESEIYITYSLLTGENITFSAVTASDGSVEEVDPVDPTPSKSIVDVKDAGEDAFDLTADGTKYWEYYGPSNDNKANADDIVNSEFQDGGQAHFDNPTSVKWSDGATETSKETPEGYNAKSITVTVSTAGCTTLKLMTGAWNATNRMTVYGENNVPLESLDIAVGTDKAKLVFLTVDLSEYKGQTIKIFFEATNSNGGNVSLTAIAVK